MRRPTIHHQHLRNVINEIRDLKEQTPSETFEILVGELIHSCLLMPANKNGKELDISIAVTENANYGLLFTDMYEFRKSFPDYGQEAIDNSFDFYKNFALKSDLDGMIINPESEGFVLIRDFLDLIDESPRDIFPTENAYTPEELKDIKDSISNDDLEKFIQNTVNIGKYEELFNQISKSTLLTLMLSRDDLTDHIENGIISMDDGPLGFLYTENLGGEYATVYTSEDKLKDIETPHNRFSQVVNFSQMTNFILNDDMDGIIINPGCENILLTRDVLLKYYGYIEKTCYNEKLNTSILHMYVIEG